MTNLTTIPLQDDFETSLKSSWSGGTGTVSVNATPTGSMPTGGYSYIVVNPGKTNMQVAKIDGWDGVANTFNVTSITIKKGVGVNYTTQTHAANSVVRFSNNFQFWYDIQQAINSKADTDHGIFTNSLQIPVFATAAARDLATGTPADGMLCYRNDIEDFNFYKNGTWVVGLGGGGGSGGIRWKDSSTDGTLVGDIDGVNTVYTTSNTPGTANAVSVIYNGVVMEKDQDYTLIGSTITFTFAPVTGKIVVIYPDIASGFSTVTTRGTTDADSNNGELYRSTDDAQSLYYKDNGGTSRKLVDATTGKLDEDLLSNASETVAGNVEIATTAEFNDGTDIGGTGAILAPKPSDIKNKFDSLTNIFGDGSDGDVTISVDTTLSADKYYNNLTINAGIKVNTAGYRIYVKGTLTNNGTIRNNGGNASGQTGGTAGIGGAAGGTGGNGGSGSGGGSGTGGNGGSQVANAVVTANGGAGGTGGDVTTYSPGGGGVGGTPSSTTTMKIVVNDWFTGTIVTNSVSSKLLTKIVQILRNDNNAVLGVGNGGGGGGGGGWYTNSAQGAVGGGGGGGGGYIVVLANIIAVPGIYEAKGGNGANGNPGTGTGGEGGGGGGGGGGAGGLVVLGYVSITGSPTITVTGGTKGNFGAGYPGPAQNASDGVVGDTGYYAQIALDTIND